jgi:hypothetical protein
LCIHDRREHVDDGALYKLTQLHGPFSRVGLRGPIDPQKSKATP